MFKIEVGIAALLILGSACGELPSGAQATTTAAGTSPDGGMGDGGCVAAWDPTWRYAASATDWWAEFTVAGGGVLATEVWVEIAGTSTTTSLNWSFGRWAGRVTNLTRGTSIVLHARDALGATAQTEPFRFLEELAPATAQCRGTPRTNTTCQPLARGMVTITIDDSGSSQRTIAAPLLNLKEVKATFFHVPNFLDWVSDARAFAEQGHETGSHTMSHRSLTTLSALELDDELRLSKQWLEVNVSAGVESFATPSGAYDAAAIAAVKPYYASHRTTNEGMNFVGTDVYLLRTHLVLNTHTAAALCAQLEEAAALKSWLIYTFHDFTNGTATQGFTVTGAVFDAFLTCAKNTPGLDIVTQREGVAAIRCGSP